MYINKQTVHSNFPFHWKTEKPQEHEEKEIEATVIIQVWHLLRWWSAATSLNRGQLCQFVLLESLHPRSENIQSSLEKKEKRKEIIIVMGEK